MKRVKLYKEDAISALALARMEAHYVRVERDKALAEVVELQRHNEAVIKGGFALALVALLSGFLIGVAI